MLIEQTDEGYEGRGMQKQQESSSHNNFLKNRFLRNIFVIALILTLMLPVSYVVLVHPAFTKLLIEDKVDDAVSIARHLSYYLPQQATDVGTTYLPVIFLNEAVDHKNHFGLRKLKVFSKFGEVIFSTDTKDVGTINKEKYLQEVMEKAKPYTQVVTRHTKTLEGQTISADVVETYVPIKREANVLGAFEIYYDITRRNDQLHNLLLRSTATLTIFAGGLLSLLMIVLFKEHRTISARKRAEEEVRRAHDELEQRVEERTAELVETNERLRQEIEERKRMEKALRNSQKELRFLSSELLEAQENERARFARELHDGIGQALSTIKVRVETLLRLARSDVSRIEVEDLVNLVSMIRQTVEEVRNTSMDLRPSTLDSLGILPTIDWFCREFQTTYPVIRIRKKIDIQESEVPDFLKIIIYRILQEGLSNAASHSRADLVTVSLAKTDGEIMLALQDNGRGFDLEDVLSADAAKRGFGLTSMKERTELSGGSFAIESSVGEGTTIRATWKI